MKPGDIVMLREPDVETFGRLFVIIHGHSDNLWYVNSMPRKFPESETDWKFAEEDLVLASKLDRVLA